MTETPKPTTGGRYRLDADGALERIEGSSETPTARPVAEPKPRRKRATSTNDKEA